jgi:hypothetical protein
MFPTSAAWLGSSPGALLPEHAPPERPHPFAESGRRRALHARRRPSPPGLSRPFASLTILGLTSHVASAPCFAHPRPAASTQPIPRPWPFPLNPSLATLCHPSAQKPFSGPSWHAVQGCSSQHLRSLPAASKPAPTNPMSAIRPCFLALEDDRPPALPATRAAPLSSLPNNTLPIIPTFPDPKPCASAVSNQSPDRSCPTHQSSGLVPKIAAPVAYKIRGSTGST